MRRNKLINGYIIILLYCYIVVFPLSVFAQSAMPPATADSAKVKTGFFHKPKIVLDLDGRNSFVFNRRTQTQYDAYIFGLRTGLVFRQRIRIGIGLYCLGCFGSLAPPLVFPRDDTTAMQIKVTFGYFSFFTEYIFLKTKRWEFSIPLTIGIGSANMARAKDETSKFEPVKKEKIAVGEVALVGHYKITKWFGVGGSVGYRNVFSSEKLFQKGLDAPIWTVNIEAYLGEIYRTAKGWYKKKKSRA